MGNVILENDVLAILEKYASDPVVEVAETCQIALDRIGSLTNKSKPIDDNNPYASVDPAPPAATKDIAELKATLLNENAKLFDRYTAMFALRNLRTTESVLALCEGLKFGCGSALFRHEVAFVLGQLQEECSVPSLEMSLRNVEENEMVRHESAEALGSIATEECVKILNEFLDDKERVVRESCIVALDMSEYENSPEFQYANALTSC